VVADCIIDRNEFAASSAISMPDGTITVDPRLYCFISNAIIPGKVVCHQLLDLKQFLADVYAYVMQHCHMFCSKCHGRSNFMRCGTPLYKLLNVKMTVLSYFGASITRITDVCPINFEYRNIRYIIPEEKILPTWHKDSFEEEWNPES
jgi:hypothetical protein